MRRLLFYSLLCTLFCASLTTGALAGVRFAVFSDPHFYDPSLGTEGPAFEAYLAQDRKLLRESEALTQAMVDNLIKIHQNNPLDFVLVPGDLSKDGERSSHEKFATYLAQLEAAGIDVYVAPGNHDINNPHAMAFSGDTVTPTAHVSPDEFKSIYQAFGYKQARANDPDSLSYMAEPVPGVVLLSLDSCKYRDNLSLGHPETSGAFSPATQAWIIRQIKIARAAGKQVIAMEHHGILEHYTGQSQAFADYVIDDWQNLSQSFAEAGLGLMFTGHYHSSDITEKTWEASGATLYDVETGSLVTSPCPYRIVTLHGGNAAQIETRHIEEIPYDTGGVAFPVYARNFLYQGLLGIAQYTLKVQYGLPDAQVTALAPLVADAFAAHYTGDEYPDAATLGLIQQFLATPDPTVQFLGQNLYALWTDLAPTDNRALLSLDPAISLTPMGTYESGMFLQGAAEIVAFDPKTSRLFVSNAQANSLDVLNAADPTHPVRDFSLDLSPYGAGVNSVAVHHGLVAVAMEAEPKQNPGRVVFFTANGDYLNQVKVGALPDMLAFTPDGSKLLVANEGEPNDDYSVDPEGSVSVIDLGRGVARAKVRTADFLRFNSKKDVLLDQGIRLFGPGASVAQDLEPEYIAVTPDGRTAWVTLQENNALAKVDIQAARVVALLPLGVKDLGRPENALDASDKDGGINFAHYANVFGVYQPDAIAAYQVGGRTFLVTANEGDSRDYDGFSEEARVKDLTLDPAAFPNAAALQKNEALGRLKVTTTLGDSGGDGMFEQLYAFGGRSFSILEPTPWGLRRIFDSGKQFEELTAAALPFDFNSNNDANNSFDERSDDKGPEPEGLAIGEIAGRTYLFLGLERVSGIMVYDISNPARPEFVQYINNRDFSGDSEAGTAGDLGPEGLTFIPARKSPTGMNMLAVANEVSGTTTLYQIDVDRKDCRRHPWCRRWHYGKR